MEANSLVGCYYPVRLFTNIPGLGQYLQELAPEKFPTWIVAIQHVLILCRIHFQRSIRRIVPEHERRGTVYERMEGLLTAGSQQEYREICDWLITST